MFYFILLFEVSFCTEIGIYKACFLDNVLKNVSKNFKNLRQLP